MLCIVNIAHVYSVACCSKLCTDAKCVPEMHTD